MATTTVILNDAMIGKIVSPGPDGFVVGLRLLKSQVPPWQQENWLPFPLPFGRWMSGRFVLRQSNGRRLINVSTQCGALSAGYTLLTIGQSFSYSGSLVLEALPMGQEWELQISDVPLTTLQQVA